MSQSVKNFLPLVILLLAGCSLVGQRHSNDADAVLFENKMNAAEQSYSSGNFESAEKLFEEANKLNPNNVQVIYRLGTISYRKGDTAKAAKYFDDVIKIDPRNSKAHFNLATIRLMQAESHFKYYIATVDPKADIERLSELIGAIEEYASSEKK